jgi:hypothetical protein
MYEPVVDSLEQVDPPEGVIYSHSTSLSWCDEPFSPTEKNDVETVVWSTCGVIVA